MALLAASLLAAVVLCWPGAARAEECACDDGHTTNNNTANCCGGDSQRKCAIPGVFSQSQCTDRCIDPAEEVGTHCAEPRGIGDYCTFYYPCEDPANTTCTLFNGAFRCVPKVTVFAPQTLWNAEECAAFHNAAHHVKVMENGFFTTTYGTGNFASGAYANSKELGVAYGGSGEFGCYYTECTGIVTNLEAGIYSSIGQYWEWESLSGTSYLIAGSAGETIGYAANLIYGQPPPGTPTIGVAFALTLSLGISPGDAGGLTCNTTLTEVMPYLGSEQWVDLWNFGAETGEEDTPWNTLQEGLDNLGGGNPPRVYIEEGQGYCYSITGNALTGPVELLPDPANTGSEVATIVGEGGSGPCTPYPTSP